MPKIYTKKGDGGKTEILGKKLSKDDILVEALGSIDELNSWIGLVRAQIQMSNDKFTIQIQNELTKIQNNLLVIGSMLVGSRRKLGIGETRRLEKLIDKLEKDLPPLANFIYPVGELQVARAVARRVERSVVRLVNNTLSDPPLNTKNQKDSSLLTSFAVRGGRGSYILEYLNRLSDALFVMGRWVNRKNKIPEEIWK